MDIIEKYYTLCSIEQTPCRYTVMPTYKTVVLRRKPVAKSGGSLPRINESNFYIYKM